MPLVWRDDFAGTAADGSSLSTKILARVQDTQKPMPPVTTTLPMMNPESVDVLQSWFETGMPGVQGGACEEAVVPPDTGPSWSTQPWPEDECEYVLTIGAHGASGTPREQDPTAYTPPPIETTYHCFYEKVPWGTTPVQALALRANVEADDREIVHHMVLSSLGPDDGVSLLGGARPTQGGAHYDCPNPNGSTVGVWAPGAPDGITFPKDVGARMPSGNNGYMELQIHYNNPALAAGKQSRVSFDICVTSKLRSQSAGVHWLGYENAAEAVPLAILGPELQPPLDNQGGGVAVGTCTAKERTRLLWVAPHMHELGRHAKIEVLRADGTVEVIHDAPFTFEEQTAYFQDDLWIEQGEKIRTTCTWETSRKIVFGFASREEMCFAYALSYPVGALAGVGAEKGVVGGDLSCAGGG